MIIGKCILSALTSASRSQEVLFNDVSYALENGILFFANFSSQKLENENKRIGPTVMQHIGPTVMQHIGPTVMQHIGPTVMQHIGPTVMQYIGPTVMQHIGPTVMQHIGPTVMHWKCTHLF